MPEEDRIDFYRLCRAIIDFEQKGYNKVVAGTVNITFKTVSFEANRRALLLCAYYELIIDDKNFKQQDKYADLFEKNITNFIIYLKKHKPQLASLQFEQYHNFIKFVQHLKKNTLIFDILQKENPERYHKQINQLAEIIQTTDVLLYKNWLIQKIKNLQSV